MRTTSGASAWTCSTAAAPSAASPTTCRSGSAARIMRSPARTSSWSSTSRIEVTTRPAGCGRGPGSRPRGTVPTRAARHERPRVAQTGQSATGAGHDGPPAPAVVTDIGDLDLESRPEAAYPHVRRRPGACRATLTTASRTTRKARVAAGPPVGRAPVVDLEVHADPAAHRGDPRPVERSLTGLDGVQSVAELGEAHRGGVDDRPQRRGGVGPGALVTRRLHAHHGHRVRDGVVQPAGERLTLLGTRQAYGGAAPGLQLAHHHLRAPQPLLPPCGDPTDGDGSDGQHHDDPGGVAGVRVLLQT